MPLNDIRDQLSVFVLLVQTTGGHRGLAFSMTAPKSKQLHLTAILEEGKQPSEAVV